MWMIKLSTINSKKIEIIKNNKPFLTKLASPNLLLASLVSNLLLLIISSPSAVFELDCDAVPAVRLLELGEFERFISESESESFCLVRNV